MLTHYYVWCIMATSEQRYQRCRGANRMNPIDILYLIPAAFAFVALRGYLNAIR